jgi:putative phosphoribosyl transferase
MKFRDRTHAGQELARKLEKYRDRADVLVLGLPRGGIPVAYEVAQHLRAPLDVFVVRKLGVPGHEELAMGAIATGGVRVLNQTVLVQLPIPDVLIDQVTAREGRELERREREYRDGRPAPEIRGRTIILVDDGLATGSTMRAAVAALRQQAASHIVVAVPVSAVDTCRSLAAEVDEIVCARMPQPFYAVGLWYEDFDQTSDEEVRELLARAAAHTTEEAHP